MAVLDPGLKFLIGQNDNQSNTAIQIPTNQPEDLKQDVNVLVHFSGTVDKLKSSGLVVTSVAGDIAAIKINLKDKKDIEKLINHPNIKYAELARVLFSESNNDVFDDVLTEVNANEVHETPLNLTGKNVIIGLIDTGINYFHSCFIDKAGSSRILSIWDQNLVPEANEKSPSSYDYGVEYTQSQINDALKSSEDKLRHIPGADYHGTSVAAIAAGSGQVKFNGRLGNYTGMAPNANIIFVACPNNEVIGDSAITLDALTYILSQAEELGRPIVINLSRGDNIGAHDGTSLLERAIDNLMSKPGRAFVKSAGNSADKKKHAKGSLTTNSTEKIIFTISPGIKASDIIDFWYKGSDRFSVQIQSPKGSISKIITPGSGEQSFELDGNSISVYSLLNQPFNQKNRIFIKIYVSSPDGKVTSGDWILHTIGDNVVDGQFDIWIENNLSGMIFKSHNNENSTITIPGTAKKAITVGSYYGKKEDKNNFGRISPSSSLGPTLDRRNKPDIYAPGEQIISASNGVSRCKYVNGTSMAAPVVTGAIACMLGLNPTLSQEKIRECLINSARKDSSMLKLDLKESTEHLSMR